MNRYITSKNAMIALAGSIIMYKFIIEPRMRAKKVVKPIVPEKKEEVKEQPEKVIADETMYNNGEHDATANFVSKTTNKFVQGNFPVTTYNPPRRQDNDSATFIR